MVYMERKISDYIDSLNQEKKPKEHRNETTEYEELMNTVRTIRHLKEYEEPSPNLEKKLLKTIRNSKRKRIISYGAVAAVLALLLVTFSFFNLNKDIVQAMEASYKELKAYHGIMTITSVNEAGEEFIQGKREVWVDNTGNYTIHELEGSYAGTKTVNNGNKKWQIQTDEKEVEVYSAFPDTTRFTFEIGNEIQTIKNALQVQEVGEEKIQDKTAIKLAVTPQGGDIYHIWIDKETNIPIQRETAMQTAMQYLVRYEKLESIESIPEELLTYEIPEGYTEVNKSLEQIVTSIEEVKEILGFEPLAIRDLPTILTLKNMTVDTTNYTFRIYYKVNGISQEKDKNFILLQKKAFSIYEKEPTSILGTVNGNPAEYIPSIRNDGNFISYATGYGETSEIGMIRWQENGYEYALIGDISLETLTYIGLGLIGEEINFTVEEENEFQPEVEVTVDLEIEENTQKSVDSGSSPWKLDPAYVASVEVSLLMSPDGIVEENPLAYEDIEIVYNDGNKAIAEISKKDSPVQKIYLEKLVRQDETGIWTMVGYDNALH